ncbi:hypothetical protein L3X38_004227 [Prunus dulcis]|uniref:Uncharacterized protein n=1 Tax=Prunus dulcis TaxID=3755 RepID=A0AAD4ZNL4_PRUDU|nr:hypothetical protein L3X38_004227 [Prunus dulcis]
MRAKNKILKLLKGIIKEQYARLWDYVAELRKINPGTTVQIKCDHSEELQQPVFICLGLVKKGFKAGCRPLIGLGGCQESLRRAIAISYWFNHFGFTFISHNQNVLLEAFEVVANFNTMYKEKMLKDAF